MTVTGLFSEWQKSVASFTKDMEDASAKLWDGWLRDARTLEGMGMGLSVIALLKDRWDRALEESWGRFRLASSADAERIHERLSAIEAELAAVAARLDAREAPRA